MAARSVVLLSGGLDSATTLAMARANGDEVYALSVDYGQRHRRELACAAVQARLQGAVEHRTVRLDLRAIGGSALTDRVDVPKDYIPLPDRRQDGVKYLDLDDSKVADPNPAIQLVKDLLSESGK